MTDDVAVALPGTVLPPNWVVTSWRADRFATWSEEMTTSYDGRGFFGLEYWTQVDLVLLNGVTGRSVQMRFTERPGHWLYEFLVGVDALPDPQGAEFGGLDFRKPYSLW